MNHRINNSTLSHEAPSEASQQRNPAHQPQVREAREPSPSPRGVFGRGAGGLIFGLAALVGGTLLAGKNAYDRNVGRYRDSRGRFRGGRFF